MSQAKITETLPYVSLVESAAVETVPGFDQLYVRRPRLWLGVLLVAFLIVGVRYASITPAWQAPDEPAHYNYIAYIANNATLPMLRLGDYNQRELAYLLALGFPADYPIDGFRYEFYQPPLYYILATPVFWATDGSLFALRLFSLGLGIGSLLLLYLCLELVFPHKPLIRLGATAFAAMLPMHVAVASSVNNDMLAEFLTLASALVLLHWMRGYFYHDAGTVVFSKQKPEDGLSQALPAETFRSQRLMLALGVLLGLGMLTKIYAYALAPIFSAVILWTVWRTGRSCQRLWQHLWQGLRTVLWAMIPALALALPLWIRNVLIYPGWDFLALRWHDLVVRGQPTTADWIAEYGSLAYFERAFSLTFQSFWGVFGWLTVLMDERIYTAALIFTGILFLGVLWACLRLISGAPDTDMDAFQTSVIAILGLLLVAVAASFVWYNLKFVQHQGRYFFWGMLAISAVVALGWREVLHPLQGTITGMLGAALAGSMVISYAMGDPVNNWTLVIVAFAACFLMLQPLLLIGSGYRHPWRRLNQAAPWLQRGPLPSILRGLRFVAWATPFLLLFVLNLIVPNWFIVQQLHP